MTISPLTAFRGRLCIFLLILACALPIQGEAQQENRLRRVKIDPHPGFTRINLFFQAPPEYTLSILPDRVQLNVRHADCAELKKFAAYSDAKIGGVFFALRDGGVRVTIPVKEKQPGVQVFANGSPTMLSVDIGASVKRAPQVDIAPGRESILAGTEKFVHEFQAPARAGLPFMPTDSNLLKRYFSVEEVKLFQLGEGLLYRERASEAIPVFSTFIAKPAAPRALAWYRLAGALCLQERNQEALKAFRYAESLWPGYLEQAPELMLSYAEVRSKCGDYPGGKAMLVRLIDRLAGSPYVPPLLTRLADMTLRNGETARALDLYRKVVISAPGTEAASRARLKLADTDMFSVSRDHYRDLLERYRAIYEAPGEFTLRDEALFKVALLHGLYGPAKEALEATTTYDRRYPRGIFATIIKKMREDLLLLVYRELHAAKDAKGLVHLAQDNKEYLARCLADADFAPRLAQAFRECSLLSQEIPLFSYLSERTWAGAAAPYLAERIVEDSLELGNLPLAEARARGFLTRFPGDARAQRVRELLGRMAFEKKDLKAVIAELGFLNGKAPKAEFAESNYYLGKALSAGGDQRGAERSLSRFVAQAPAGAPLLMDGYFAAGGARVALKRYPEALATYRQGEKLASGETADQFLYKIGELYLQMKMVRQARESWEKVAARQAGGTWSKLASQSLDDLNWRLKISKGLP
jgi:tetratricopeptide (TPR) repeat protein